MIAKRQTDAAEVARASCPCCDKHWRDAGATPIPNPQPPRAFTLVEVMVVLIVVAVLTSFCIPSFQRALEQSRVDVAAANLRAIWSAERIYWLENHSYTNNFSTLQSSGLIGPETTSIANGFSYSATASDDAFTVTATREGNTFWSGQVSINQTGVISGSTISGGGTVITPGYQ